MLNEKSDVTRQAVEKDQEHLNGLANKLDVLQKTKNEGRGVSCVATIAAFLWHGDARAARVCCFNEFDKIQGKYPDIEELLKRELFTGGEESPWGQRERMLKKQKEGPGM